MATLPLMEQIVYLVLSDLGLGFAFAFLFRAALSPYLTFLYSSLVRMGRGSFFFVSRLNLPLHFVLYSIALYRHDGNG